MLRTKACEYNEVMFSRGNSIDSGCRGHGKAFCQRGNIPQMQGSMNDGLESSQTAKLWKTKNQERTRG